MKPTRILLSGLFVAMGLIPQVQAADLKVALATPATSLDPLFYVGGSNSALARNIFDPLVIQDEKQGLTPGLALSWHALSDTEWEFKLRPGVRFHDGSPFGAQDVAASIRRVALAAENSPSSFLQYVKDIKDIKIVDDLTIRFSTASATPLLPNNLSRISIVPRSEERFTTKQFNDGEGVIGTGPFKFAGWQRDDHVSLTRNDEYWAGAAHWDKVTLRFVAADGARVSASLAGDVDVVESIPTPDVSRLKADTKLTVVSNPSNRVLYLHPDQDREVSPFAVGPDGKNPLRSPEVRRAMALAINRKALIERMADGQGTVAEQLVPKGYFGWSPNIKPLAYDPEQAKALLKKAGLENGFKLTFHASNDRYPNDAKIAQALGQMWSRVGIQTQIITLPGSVYFPQAAKREFSLIMGGAAVETGEASGILGPLLATYGPQRGQGNRGRYSNSQFDQALDQALVTLDDNKRQTLLREAGEIGMNDLGVIPLFFITNNWALRKGLQYGGRSDGYTLPYYIHPKQ